MKESTIRNARIGSTVLGSEDHGIMSFYLNLDYGGGGQGAGGYALDEYDKSLDRRIGRGHGIEIIKRILVTVGVSKWEDLPGKYVRCEQTDSKVLGIGHIIEDKWLNFKELIEELKGWEEK
uniref:Uncharacterized protein n=1 Tax=viral metagenome TaxID=1070528 RepID=A0A6M3LCX9_9ZZZZ